MRYIKGGFNMRTVSFTIDDAGYKKLERASSLSGLTKSEILRESLNDTCQHYISENVAEISEPSAYELLQKIYDKIKGGNCDIKCC